MPKRQSALSLEFFLIPVEVVVPEVANPDLTADEVQFNFVVGGLPTTNRSQPSEDPNLPQSTGWISGTWVTTATGQVYAAINVGPGGDAALPRGKFAAWIRVVDNPTVPVAPVDSITVY